MDIICEYCEKSRYKCCELHKLELLATTPTNFNNVRELDRWATQCEKEDEGYDG